jgi:hypothetical protein
MAEPNSSLVYVDPSFEGVILASLLQRHPDVEASDILPYLKGDLFSVEAYRWIVRQFGDSVPSREVLNQIVHESYAVDLSKRDQYLAIIENLFAADLSKLADAMVSIRRYIVFERTSMATVKFHERFKETRDVRNALEDLRQEVNAAATVLSSNAVIIVDYARDWQRREEARIHKRDNPDLHPRLLLGVPMFDQQVKMIPGTVTNFLAPMKRYKSVILASAAFSALLQGFNVCLVVAENTIDLTLSRMDAMVTRIGYERIVNALKTPQEQAYADTLLARLDSWGNRVKVIKGEPYRIGMVETEAACAKLEKEEQFIPEVTIFDYLNIAKPSTTVSITGERLRDNDLQTQICWDMQSYAKRKGRESIVVTATQANMAGLETDTTGKPIKINASHQGRSIGIAQAVDATIAVNLEVTQTEDSGWQPPQILLSLLYLRDGKIIQPDIKLESVIDAMCIDVNQRSLWDEASDNLGNPGDPPW